MHIERMADSRSNYEVLRTMAASTDGSAIRTLLLDDGTRSFVTGADVLPIRSAAANTVSMVTLDYYLGAQRPTVGSHLAEKRRDDGWVSTLFDVDTATGKGRVAERGTPYTRQWLVDPQGKPIARTEWKPDTRELPCLPGTAWDGDRFTSTRAMTGLARRTHTRPQCDRRNRRKRRRSIQGLGDATRRVTSDGRVRGSACGRYERNRRSRYGLVVGYWIGGTDSNPTTPTRIGQRCARHWKKHFPSQGVYIADLSSDGQRCWSGRSRARVRKRTIWWTARHTRAGHWRQLSWTRWRPAGRGPGHHLCSPRWRDDSGLPDPAARQGRKDPAAGSTRSRGPGITRPWRLRLVGPVSRDPWIRGAATAVPGLDRLWAAHRLAGYHQWGGLMQDDVTDGVRHLVSTGFADPSGSASSAPVTADMQHLLVPPSRPISMRVRSASRVYRTCRR